MADASHVRRVDCGGMKSSTLNTPGVQTERRADPKMGTGLISGKDK